VSTNSRIEWTEATWNPVTGCTKISPGCAHCYAERMAKRLQAMGQPRYRNGFQVTCHDDALDEPLRWRKPRRIFVCSMGDLFHEDVQDPFLCRVFRVMSDAKQHTFQVLTKRADRAEEWMHGAVGPDNLWLGATVESRAFIHRIRDLPQIDVPVRFVSFEPLLGPVGRIPLKGIHWMIVGGEFGPGARPMDPDWARKIRDQCRRVGIPFFMKQMGGVVDKRSKLADIPPDLRIREMPT